MFMPVVALLWQTTQAPAVSTPDAKPVRVWLDTDSPLRRGAAVRVYVEAGMEGNLVVLHRRTDGHIGVLFPADPRDDPFVRPGTYEIRGRGDRAGLVVAEPDGTGMILAALSPDPLRVNEFVRLAAWNEDALVPAWAGEDAEGVMSDIVQRMLGDGVFNYDLVTYTVAPPVYAEQQDTTPPVQDSTTNYAAVPPCSGCTYIGEEFLVLGPAFFCDGYLDQCFVGGSRRHRDARCAEGSRCAPPPTPALAYTGPRSTGPLATGLAAERAPGSPGTGSAPAGARAAASGRAAAAAPRPAIPLSPGASAGATANRGALGAPSARRRAPYDAPLTHVRFTLVSAPASEATGASRSRGVEALDARTHAGLSAGAAAGGGAGWGGAERLSAGAGGGGGGGGGGGARAQGRSAAPRQPSAPRTTGAVPSRARPGPAAAVAGPAVSHPGTAAPEQLALGHGSGAGTLSPRGGSARGGGGRR